MACKGNLMATFQFEGIDNYIAQLQKMYDDTDEIIGAAIYQGAAVVMKSVVSAIENIQTDDRYGTLDDKKKGPTTYQKEGLRRAIGIASLRNDGGFYNVKIGFDGYNGVKTKRWPNGQPNAMVARSVESGTSFMEKQRRAGVCTPSARSRRSGRSRRICWRAPG